MGAATGADFSGTFPLVPADEAGGRNDAGYFYIRLLRLDGVDNSNLLPEGGRTGVAAVHSLIRRAGAGKRLRDSLRRHEISQAAKYFQRAGDSYRRRSHC